jgi:hypothetical protein
VSTHYEFADAKNTTMVTIDSDEMEEIEPGLTKPYVAFEYGDGVFVLIGTKKELLKLSSDLVKEIGRVTWNRG